MVLGAICCNFERLHARYFQGLPQLFFAREIKHLCIKIHENTSHREKSYASDRYLWTKKLPRIFFHKVAISCINITEILFGHWITFFAPKLPSSLTRFNSKTNLLWKLFFERTNHEHRHQPCPDYAQFFFHKMKGYEQKFKNETKFCSSVFYLSIMKFNQTKCPSWLSYVSIFKKNTNLPWKTSKK